MGTALGGSGKLLPGIEARVRKRKVGPASKIGWAPHAGHRADTHVASKRSPERHGQGRRRAKPFSAWILSCQMRGPEADERRHVAAA